MRAFCGELLVRAITKRTPRVIFPIRSYVSLYSHQIRPLESVSSSRSLNFSADAHLWGGRGISGSNDDISAQIRRCVRRAVPTRVCDVVS